MKKLLLTILLLTNKILYLSVTKVAVFCSADDKASEQFKFVARKLGHKLGENEFGLVTGGSKTGLMKEIIDGYVQKASNLKNLYGVIPTVLKKYNIHHFAIPENQLIWVEGMHSRLEQFHKLSDIIIILPGGFGTLHELMDFLVSKQFSLNNKQIILFNIDGYWNNLLKLFQTMQENNLLTPAHQNIFTVVNNEQECINKLINSVYLDKENRLDAFYWQKKT